MKAKEAGFSLVEIIVAAALFVLLVFVAARGARNAGSLMQNASLTQHGVRALDDTVALLTAEANTAFAISVPSDPACSDTAGGEVAFFTRDDAGQNHYSKLTYHPELHALERSIYRAGAWIPTANQSNGVTVFRARCIPASQLAAGGPEVGREVADRRITLDRSGVIAGLDGGNHVVEVAVVNAAGSRTVHLLPRIAPTSFTVVGPDWHAIFRRQENTRRFLFGFGQKTDVHVFGRITVSYDGWRTRQLWCDNIDLFGVMSVGDPRAEWNPNLDDYHAETLLQRCRRGWRNHPPAPDPPPPAPYAAPLPVPTGIQETIAPPGWWCARYGCPPSGSPPPYFGCDPAAGGTCTLASPPA